MNIKNLGSKGALLGIMAFSTAVGAAGGATLFNTIAAHAQSTDTLTAVTAQTAATPSAASGGHVGANGTKEELLTGDTAEKVKAAALTAVPGGTIQRVETDAEGSPYEAHMTKSDGSRVTVKVDSNFKVTSTDSGMR